MSYYVIIRGPMGSGKTTVAKQFSKKLHAQCVSVDDIIDQHGLVEDREEGYISQKSFLRANDIVITDASKYLESGAPVVFDGNFYWKSQVEDLVNRLPFLHYVFTLKVPLEICVQRDAGREKPLGHDAVCAIYRKVTEFEYGIKIDATRTVEQCVIGMLSNLPR